MYNKAVIDRMIPDAYRVLKDNGVIVKKNKIKKSWRGQISTFGAAVSMGSLLAAVAFFSNEGNSSVKRDELMKCIWELVEPNGHTADSFFDYVRQQNTEQCKENVLNAAIALKLAMNLFELIKDTDKEEG